MPEVRRTLHESVMYPTHPPRQATALFEKSRHWLLIVEDRPCHICGVCNSTLKDPAQNRYGAKVMEAHHWWIEDSLANAIDLAKFNARLRPALLHRTENEEKYGHNFTQGEMIAWIHGDVDNLRSICDVHHRHALVGIHSITGPIWGVQDLIRNDFDLTGFVAYSPAEAAQLTALPMTTGQASSPRKE